MATKTKKTSQNKKVQRKNAPQSWTKPSLLTLGIVFSLAVIWAFILGILVGRGYHPEAYIPGLSMFFVQPANTSKETEDITKNEYKKASVLRAEELGFYEKLLRSPDKKPSGSSHSELKQQGSKKALSKKKTRTVYRYIYQVAAFQTVKPAENLCHKLRQNGYQAQMQKVQKDQKVWYRIFVPFEGLPQEAQRFKSKLAAMGISNPFIRHKDKVVD
jgi:hypothetical protein